MRDEDIRTMDATYRDWALICENVRRIVVLSPIEFEKKLLGECFPSAKVVTMEEKDWDLNDPLPVIKKFDLVMASNVFMYSSDPELWFDNVKGMTRYFWLQDAVNGSRGGKKSYLGDDRDSMRYSYLPDETSDFDDAYDLSRYERYIVDKKFYDLKSVGRHFVMFFDFGRRENAT